MNESTSSTYGQFVLPLSVVTKTDLTHLIHELERVDSVLTTTAVHTKVGLAEQSELKLAPILTDFLAQNKLQPSVSSERTELIKQLRLLKESAPVIHITFAAEADPESQAQIVQWLRTSLHPQAVITVGLQPSLVAGVYVRTPNRVHDLSLKGALKNARGLLQQDIGALRAGR